MPRTVTAKKDSSRFYQKCWLLAKGQWWLKRAGGHSYRNAVRQGQVSDGKDNGGGHNNASWEPSAVSGGKDKGDCYNSAGDCYNNAGWMARQWRER